MCSMISEQVNELREIASSYKHGGLSPILSKAADTIEVLSAKLDAKNMERSDRYYVGMWIACEDRLPEESGEYIATDELGCSTSLYYEKEENRWVDATEHYAICYPTAWMPLPEPYRP